MIIPMLCVTIFVILVVWFLLPRVARLMIHTPTAISIFVCLSMVQLMAVFISMRRSEERFSRNAETDLVCRLLLEKKKRATRQNLRGGTYGANGAVRPVSAALKWEANTVLLADG